jgi:ubiquinone/menaquinone biosynthesis C-methylase UbiE
MSTGLSPAARVRAAYDELYTRQELKESSDYYTWVGQLLALGPGETLLDMACGTGLFLKAVAPGHNGLAVGVDFSETALRVGRQNRLRPTVCVAEAEHVPLAGGHFDCVTCLGSLEHFGDPEAALAEMLRLLQPGGRLLIVVPNSFFVLDILNAWWRGRGPTHGQPLERFAALQEWQQLLETHGLRVKRVWKYNNTGAFSNGFFRITWRLARRFVPLHMSYSFVFLCDPKPL